MLRRNLNILLFLCFFPLADLMAQGNLITLGEGDQPSLSKTANGVIGISYGDGKDIYFVISKDNGSSFSKPEKVATLNGLVLGMSSGPRLSMNDDYYSIIAPDRKGDLSAWRKATDSDKWEGPFKVNDIPGSSGESLADIAFDTNGNLFATWIDTRREGMDHADMGHETKPGGHEVKDQEAGESREKVEKKREEVREDHNVPPQRLTKEEIMKQVGEMPEGAEGIRTYPGEDGKLYWVVVDKEGNALKAQDLEGYKKFKAQNGNRPKPQGKIFVSVSEDAGKTWKKSQFVYASPDGSVCECCKPSIVAGKDGIYIMFRNNVDGNRDLYVTKSENGGTSFKTPEKLGMGSWAINGCPMDGGNLDVSGSEVATVWQREGKVYFATPGSREELIGNGRSPAIASNVKGNYILWNRGPNVMGQTPGRPGAVNLGGGASPQIVNLPNGQGALAVWIDGGKVVVRRMT